MRIRFIKDHTVRQGDGKGPQYKTGEEHEFNGPIAETYGRKYVRRGLAVDTANDPKPAPVAAAPEPVTEPVQEPVQEKPRALRR